MNDNDLEQSLSRVAWSIRGIWDASLVSKAELRGMEERAAFYYFNYERLSESEKEDARELVKQYDDYEIEPMEECLALQAAKAERQRQLDHPFITFFERLLR